MKTRFDGITPGDWFFDEGRTGHPVVRPSVDPAECLLVACGTDEESENAMACSNVPQFLALLKRLARVDLSTADGKIKCKAIQADTRALLGVEEEKP